MNVNAPVPENDKLKRVDHAAARISASPPQFDIAPSKIAMVAVDWLNGEDEDSYKRAVYENGGFYPLFPDIAEVCDKHACDTVLYALWTHSTLRHDELSKEMIFGHHPKHLQNIILEVERGQYDSVIEVWNRHANQPHNLVQRVATSSDTRKQKNILIEELPARQFGHSTILICGEINIINTKRVLDQPEHDFN